MLLNECPINNITFDDIVLRLKRIEEKVESVNKSTSPEYDKLVLEWNLMYRKLGKLGVDVEQLLNNKR